MNKTIGVVKACAAVVLALALSACVTKLGRNFDDAYSQQIKPGETTKAQVLEKLGRPPLVSRTADEVTWTYAHYEGRGMWYNILDIFGMTDADIQGQGKQKRLVVTFKDDVVKDAKLIQELPIVYRY